MGHGDVGNSLLRSFDDDSSERSVYGIQMNNQQSLCNGQQVADA
jgi:hypothetical protein